MSGNDCILGSCKHLCILAIGPHGRPNWSWPWLQQRNSHLSPSRWLENWQERGRRTKSEKLCLGVGVGLCVMINWTKKEKRRETLEKTNPGPSLEGWAFNLWGTQYAGLERENVYVGSSLCPAQQAACRFTDEHYDHGTLFSTVAKRKERPGTFPPAQRFWCRPWVFSNWQERAGDFPLAKSIFRAHGPRI